MSFQRRTATASGGTVTLAPGTKIRVKLRVALVNLPDETQLILGTTDPQARALGSTAPRVAGPGSLNHRRIVPQAA